MLSKCANSTCSATFRYLREGKILLVESTPGIPGKLEINASAHREHFWLCDACSKTLTIVPHSSGARVVSLEEQSKSKAGSKDSEASPVSGLSSA
jgi:hypothetical protein